MQPINLFDYEPLAREKLPAIVYDYIAGGSDDEVSLRENRAAFERIGLRPRVLVDVSQRDLTTTVLGQQVSFPVLLAPTALHGQVHPDGECATARAAGAAGTIFVVSTLCSRSLEEIASAATGPLWFQLYCSRDRSVTEELVHRAQAAGYRALCLTVDAPYLGRRERDVRHGYALPAGYLDPALSWKDLPWLRRLTALPLVVKGILTAEDARLAVEHDAAGIVVSNHGGRQLDSAVAAVSALPEIVDAVGSDTEMYVDGGFRRGTDVLKALALGARAVLIGRPYLWGLAIDGEQGVRAVLDLLRSELDLALALAGCPTIGHLNRALVSFSR